MTWLGAAPAVALVLWDRSVADSAALRRCAASRVWPTVALVVVFAGGSASALLLTNGLAGGLTVYIWLVLAKVVVVAAAAAQGARGRRVLTRAPERGRYRRLFMVDTLLLVVVAFLSAALTLVGPHRRSCGPRRAHGRVAALRHDRGRGDRRVWGDVRGDARSPSLQRPAGLGCPGHRTGSQRPVAPPPRRRCIDRRAAHLGSRWLGRLRGAAVHGSLDRDRGRAGGRLHPVTRQLWSSPSRPDRSRVQA